VPFRTLINPNRTFAKIAISVALSSTVLLSAAVHSANQSVPESASSKGAVSVVDVHSNKAPRTEAKLSPARKAANAEAAATLAQANTVVSQVWANTNVTPMTTVAASLANYPNLNIERVQRLTAETRKAASAASAASAAATAAAAAAAQQAAAAAAAAALAAADTPNGARALASNLAATTYGWGADQFQCLDHLWTKESGWSYSALNRGSGAAGIPQALPGSKMATAGADWSTNAATQIKWGLGYIARSYGSPCAAWAHSEASNWY
jgi:hypothetical protein